LLGEPKHMDVLNVVFAGCKYTTSLVLARYARTCSLHQMAPWMEPVERCRKPKPSYGYDFGHEHVHNAPTQRDYLTNMCNMQAKSDRIAPFAEYQFNIIISNAINAAYT